MSNVLADRSQALEDCFFTKQNEKLLRELREKKDAETQKEALSACSGITDESVLEQLVACDLSCETLAALSVVPLVEVAWADGHVHENERDALLAGARKTGLAEGRPAYQLFESWLAERPDPKLFETWMEYVSELSKTFTPEAKQVLTRDLLGRARSVAEAAGGFLGLGKISSSEKAVLSELERAFS